MLRLVARALSMLGRVPILTSIQLSRHIPGYLFYSDFSPIMSSEKLDSPHFKQILTPDLLRLEKIFAKKGYTLRFVGGAVRDLLLGVSPKDIDLATDCTPDDMIRLYDEEGLRYIATGLQHGTITVHTDIADYEITTLRIDNVTDGRHAEVQFTSDWIKDAERRDLTINSMSVGFDGTLYDYFGGQRHLAEKKVLFVGNAHFRIQEDYLRILRYFRFYGRICNTANQHDSDTLVAIRMNASGLSKISAERIWMEISKILIGNFAPHLIELIYELGVGKHIGLPPNGNVEELARVWGRMYKNYHLKPVSMLVTLVKSGIEAEQLCRSWKMSNYERKLGVFVANHRSMCYENTSLKYYQDLIVDGEMKEHVCEVLLYCNRIKESEELQNWNVPVFPVSGHNLKEFGLSGRDLGLKLQHLKLKWKESNYLLSKDDLLQIL